jgi:uncharacterized RDD family membrane protein YckC
MNKITIGQRLGSMLLDHISMTVLVAILAIPLMISGFIIRRTFGINLDWLIAILVFGIYFNKDFFRGKSIAKRTIGLVVMKNNSTEVASSLQCFIRNLTIVLWPLEVFISLLSPQRRIGDFIAGTKIEPSEKEDVKSIIEDFKLWVNWNKNNA